MKTIRQRVHHRAHHGPSGHAGVSRQRRAALWMTIFAAARTVAWILCMIIILVHYAGIGGSFIHGFIATSSSVLFVTLISFYCNASTDAANLMAGMAALFSADGHAAAIADDRSPAADVVQALSANADVLAKLDGLTDQVGNLAAAVQVVMAARSGDGKLAAAVEKNTGAVRELHGLVTAQAPAPKAVPAAKTSPAGSAGTSRGKGTSRG